MPHPQSQEVQLASPCLLRSWSPLAALAAEEAQSQDKTVVVLGVKMMDRGLGSHRGGETMGVGGSPGKQVWPVDGTLRASRNLLRFPGCYSRQLFIYSEVGDAA